MLIPKPYILKKRHEERRVTTSAYGRVSPHDEDEEDADAGTLRLVTAHHEEEGEDFDFSEILVHQVCRAIIFVDDIVLILCWKQISF